MSKSYRVFTGAPPPTRNGDIAATSWKTLSSRDVSPPLPPMTIEKAGRRITLFYQNVIFKNDDFENEDKSEEWESQNGVFAAQHFSFDVKYITGSSDPEILILFVFLEGIDISSANAAGISTSGHVACYADNLSYFQDMCYMDYTGDEMTMLSEGSTISRFPTFNFSMNNIASLSSIIRAHQPSSASSKVTLLLGVLEVEGPSYVKVKTGHYAGSEVTLLKLIIGDETRVLCKMVAWRETAELWGGVDTGPGLKRGDITLFESMFLFRDLPSPKTISPFFCFPFFLFPPKQKREKFLIAMSGVMVSGLPRRHEGLFEEFETAKLQITASPNLHSQAQICYRTLPEMHENRKLRPDLRLGDSVPAVRRVGEVVGWMERMAGISPKL